jgi:hypothetical protein
MADAYDSRLEVIMACLRQMENTVLRLKQLRQVVRKGLETEMLDSMIEEAELHIAEVKRKVIQ